MAEILFTRSVTGPLQQLHLRNDRISYVIGILEGGIPAHLYFGARVERFCAASVLRRCGLNPEGRFTLQNAALNHTPQEYPAYGLGEMRALMASLRENPPEEVGGVKVARVRDYQSGDIRIPGVGVVAKTAISGSNVLYFDLADGSALVVRPSGTEPKIKMYVLARDETAQGAVDKRDRFAAFARSLSKA